jgi:hypothetical protein
MKHKICKNSQFSGAATKIQVKDWEIIKSFAREQITFFRRKLKEV